MLLLTLKVWLRAQLSFTGFMIVYAIIKAQFWYLLGIPASLLLGIPAYFVFLMLLQIVKASPGTDKISIMILAMALGVIAIAPLLMLCSHMATGNAWFWEAGPFLPVLLAPVVCTAGAIASYHNALYRLSHPHLFHQSSI